MLKRFIKIITPGFVKKIFARVFYGWSGSYDSWSTAQKKCKGYAENSILSKVTDAALKVKNGEASFERDSVVIYRSEFNFQLLTAIFMMVRNNKINILDFGGSLASVYFQHKELLKELKLNWCIVEQDHFVQEGKKNFENDELHFYDSIEKCKKDFNPDIVLLSSVLQYLEYPYKVLDELTALKPNMLIIDRTPFIEGKERITIQKVKASIYKASYPCWFFNENKLLQHLEKSYKKLYDFKALDNSNIKSEFKGLVLIKK